MKAFKYALSVLVVTVVACKGNETTTPKVTYSPDKTSVEATTPTADTTQIEISDLPIELKGLGYVLHPIGNYRVIEARTKNGYSSTYSQDRGSFTISNYRDFELTGFLTNIKVQRAENDTLVALFDKPVFIQSATFLTETGDKSNPVGVFALSDLDTNKDGKLDGNDVKTLYLGTLDKSKMQKICSDFHEMIDWNYLPTLQRLYFRSIEDTNKNGAFDKDDSVHYYYVSLQHKDWEVNEYFPVGE